MFKKLGEQVMTAVSGDRRKGSKDKQHGGAGVREEAAAQGSQLEVQQGSHSS